MENKAACVFCIPVLIVCLIIVSPLLGQGKKGAAADERFRLEKNSLAWQIEELVNSPPWMFLLGAVERVFTLIIHISLSILVLQAFVRRNIMWLFAAIGWHTLVNAVAVVGLLQEWDPLLIEAAIGLPALIIGLFIIRYFKPAGEPAQRDM